MINWIKNNFQLSIIVVLLFILLLQKCGSGGCNPPSHSSTDTVKTVDTVYTTITKEIPTYTPKYINHIKYIHDTTKIIDTVYSLGDYYSTYVYKDSLINDTLKLHIQDSITQNKIKARNIQYTLTSPKITVNNTVIQRKNEYYYGFGLVGNSKGISFFGPELLLRTKHKNVYGVGVGVNGDFQPSLSLRTYWKIGKK